MSPKNKKQIKILKKFVFYLNKIFFIIKNSDFNNLDAKSAFQKLNNLLDILISEHQWQPKISDLQNDNLSDDNSQNFEEKKDENIVHYSLEFFWKMLKKVFNFIIFIIIIVLIKTFKIF